MLLEYLLVTFENLHIPADEPACSLKGSSLWQNHTPSGCPWGHLSPHCWVQMLYFQLKGGDVYHGNGWLFDADWISISVLQEHPRRKWSRKSKIHVNLLTLRGDWEVTSPYNIHTISSKWVMRILKLIT